MAGLSLTDVALQVGASISEQSGIYKCPWEREVFSLLRGSSSYSRRPLPVCYSRKSISLDMDILIAARQQSTDTRKTWQESEHPPLPHTCIPLCPEMQAPLGV